jgi:hypothetical protein
VRLVFAPEGWEKEGVVRSRQVCTSTVKGPPPWETPSGTEVVIGGDGSGFGLGASWQREEFHLAQVLGRERAADEPRSGQLRWSASCPSTATGSRTTDGGAAAGGTAGADVQRFWLPEWARRGWPGGRPGRADGQGLADEPERRVGARPQDSAVPGPDVIAHRSRRRAADAIGRRDPTRAARGSSAATGSASPSGTWDGRPG